MHRPWEPRSLKNHRNSNENGCGASSFAARARVLGTSSGCFYGGNHAHFGVLMADFMPMLVFWDRNSGLLGEKVGVSA